VICPADVCAESRYTARKQSLFLLHPCLLFLLLVLSSCLELTHCSCCCATHPAPVRTLSADRRPNQRLCHARTGDATQGKFSACVSQENRAHTQDKD
jgi:hypothetical protein